MKKSFKISLFIVAVAMFVGFASMVSANHSWGGYHWARTANPFNLKLGDNVTTAWDSYLGTTSFDWSKSSVLDTGIVLGKALRHKSSQKDCGPTSGQVEVCNKAYGNNGWLGLAQIWISGSHITQGVAKLNDTYFNTSTYNKPAWRNLVMCQEVAHTFGLGHQDENFDNANLGTCMDYTRDPSTNQFPNQHDYDQLVSIYTHLDSTTTVNATAPSKGNKGNGNGNSNQAEIDSDNSSAWGKAIRQDAKGRDSVFEKDLGKGNKVLTHVFWVE